MDKIINYEYNPSLDGFRAIAVFLVLMIHYGILGFGWAGVQLFFVLSGYLISRSLFIEKQKEQTLVSYLRSFYWKRSLRIFPIYFLYVFCFIIICIFTQISRLEGVIFPLFTYTINIYALLPQRVSLDGIGHLWSLAVEEQFYLIWPFVIYFASLKNLKRILIYLVLLVPVLRLLVFSTVQLYKGDLSYAGEFIYLNPFSHLDAFAIGGMIFAFQDRFINYKLSAIRRMIIIVFSIVIVVGLLNLALLMIDPSVGKIKLSLVSSGGYPWLLVKNFGYVWGYSIINLFAGIVIMGVVKYVKVIPLLANKVLVYVGKISYGIYLYHVAVLIFVHWLKAGGLIKDPFILFLLFIILTILISSFSYHFIEIYFMKFKSYRSNKKLEFKL
jgi:peptidoglycan/LPS O-acetylase OafA/YrhL